MRYWSKAHRSRRVPFPFCQITLKAEKPLKDQYSKAFYRQQMSVIGTAIKQERLKLGISQAALAKRLNVRVENIQNWEHSRTIPTICYLPRIIEFLGHDPLESTKKAD
jgi:DNA-binding transcriptional regulator YiaG